MSCSWTTHYLQSSLPFSSLPFSTSVTWLLLAVLPEAQRFPLVTLPKKPGCRQGLRSEDDYVVCGCSPGALALVLKTLLTCQRPLSPLPWFPELARSSVTPTSLCSWTSKMQIIAWEICVQNHCRIGHRTPLAEVKLSNQGWQSLVWGFCIPFATFFCLFIS